MEEKESLIEAIKQVDVVICAVAAKQALDQKLLVEAIKLCGNVKVFSTLSILQKDIRFSF